MYLFIHNPCENPSPTSLDKDIKPIHYKQLHNKSVEIFSWLGVMDKDTDSRA